MAYLIANLAAKSNLLYRTVMKTTITKTKQGLF